MQSRYHVQSFILAAAFAFSAFLSGCGAGSDMREFQMQVQEKIQSGGVQVAERQTLADNEEEMIQHPVAGSSVSAGEIEEACQTILEFSTGEFVGYHLIDDTFLLWFSEEYGGECVIQIAREAQSKEPDPDIWYELTGNTIHVLWLIYCERTGFQQYQLENVAWQLCASSSKTTLAFTGDINFAEGYVTTKHMDSCVNGIYDCFSEDLLELMNGMDVMMINNEFAYSERGTALKGKAFTFRANPSRVKLLKAFGTDIVNLANNHVYDYGPDALLDTVAALDGEGIPHVGAGANLKEAGKPYYFICNGRKIAIVAATQIERSLNYTKEATEDSPGVLKTLKADKFIKVIKQAKKNSDCVIAVVHWGTEGDSNYGRDQSSLAKEFVAAGADAIIGGHTHCLQGFEMMDGVPIIYSLGNFWFSGSEQDTGLAQVTIDEKGELSLSFIPCIQKNIRTELVTDEAEKQRIFTFMQEHSAPNAQVTEEGILKQGSAR